MVDIIIIVMVIIIIIVVVVVVVVVIAQTAVGLGALTHSESCCSTLI